MLPIMETIESLSMGKITVHVAIGLTMLEKFTRQNTLHICISIVEE